MKSSPKKPVARKSKAAVKATARVKEMTRIQQLNPDTHSCAFL